MDSMVHGRHKSENFMLWTLARIVAKFDWIDSAFNDGDKPNNADARPPEDCAVANTSGGTADASDVVESTAMR